MAPSASLTAFVFISLSVARFALAQTIGSALVPGGESSPPWNISEASWATVMENPNATYTIGISGPKLTEPDHDLTPGAWDISIGITADISLAGTADNSLNKSLVFTGTQVNFAPAFNMTAPTGAEWEACFVIGLPGIQSTDSDAIGPMNAAGFNEGYCNFLSLSCQNDLEAAIILALTETESLSCANAGSITVPDSCGNSISWDTLYVLGVNQSMALKGGVLFEYGDVPHDKGNMTAYGEAVDKIWGLLSAWRLTTFNPDGTNSTLLLDQDFNCVQARTITQGSSNPPNSSTGTFIHFPAVSLLVLVAGGMVAFLIS